MGLAGILEKVRGKYVGELDMDRVRENRHARERLEKRFLF